MTVRPSLTRLTRDKDRKHGDPGSEDSRSGRVGGCPEGLTISIRTKKVRSRRLDPEGRRITADIRAMLAHPLAAGQRAINAHERNHRTTQPTNTKTKPDEMTEITNAQVTSNIINIKARTDEQA